MKDFFDWLLALTLTLVIMVLGIGLPFWFMYKICQGIYHILLLLINKI